MTRAAALSDWLTLARCPGLGPRVAQRLLTEHGGDPGAVLSASRTVWRDAGLSAAGCDWLARPDEKALAEDRAWLDANDDRHFIHWQDTRYPPSLADIDDSPPWLFAIGDTDLLAVPGLAIVGSRNPTPGGRENATGFARELAAGGLSIISGLASGIDTAAHQGALAAQGMTIAVCGTGLDRVYPARNRDLARQIGSQGLLLSEFHLGTEARPGHFPRRNRLIAGLTLGTLVVEAARASGSLITARLASESGREVFAIPGSIHNPLARGCHQLIRDGATLVESAGDILAEIGHRLPADAPVGDRPTPETATATPADPDQKHLLDAMGDGPARVDELVARTALTPEAVSSMLLIMELQGLVATAPGGAFTRTRESFRFDQPE
ncbi:DNA-processing protein DprA [Salinisphaera sp. P385]|uniref:DNA-processing protein DprA n=1 Tax=Spectribacter acetivorans TaxID=3075603 RepID=A0ABU3B8V9_9GAMM|nr:DNA-processing protein DprA [Salinisphaera sp. P385]MDT0618906.1 DNA-processing protein DprA [Salinisphaera sp. P385]